MTAPQPSPLVTIPGNHGRALGCSADWLPDCDRLALTLQPDGGYAGTFDVPVGFYEYKVAVGGSWAENYGAGGAPFGPNIGYNWAGGRIVFHYDPSTHVSWCTAGGGFEAIWADRGTLLVAPQAVQLGRDARVRLAWTLHSTRDAELDATLDPGTGVVTTLRLGASTPTASRRFPQYKDHLALLLNDGSTAAEALRGQLLLVGRDDRNQVRYATGVQIAGVLDDLYSPAANLALGVTWSAGTPSIAVWAPTAQSVALLLWPSDDLTATPDELPMAAEIDGSWTIAGKPSWADRPYRFRVGVFAPSTGKVEVNDVTDPYSVGLTPDSTHSLLLDLADPSLAPQVFLDQPGPRTTRAVDLTIYEMHVRDFSIGDPTVPVELRGTYSAFGVSGSAGTTHLAGLAGAGVNTLELLPTFDFTTVPETPPQRETLDLGHLPADSEEQQRTVGELAEADGYNWGYDPFHWQVPEGSYAVGDGLDRIREFRGMVGALHGLGFNVVLDQVFNHTGAAGQDPKSVLDRVVPGYYHRLDEIGRVYTTTCCSNVATEHLMAGKLLVDSVVVWARHYRVDGFRFDLMGFHSRDTMLAARSALNRLTIGADGIDGRRIHLFGEGWNFGEVAYDRLFVQARQGNLGGTAIGTFNDRLRDAVHGGGSGDAEIRRQGFGSGLFTDPNPAAADQGDPGTQLWRLRNYTDLVQLGLAGNLRDYAFRMGDGRLMRGDQIDYNGQQAGYCDQPDEAVNYVDAHDNQTLFDTLLLRLPDATPLADVVRMHTLSLATVVLSQSLCFVLGGSDLLRSKSFDANSYNSGDWFNQIDWSGTTNGFGRGLPPARANSSRWSALGPLLIDPANRPTASDIAASAAQVRDLFRLRASTVLFRLGSGELIKTKVSFPISGPSAEPGTIVMLIDDTVGPDVDPALDALLVVFNATPHDVTQTVPLLTGRDFELHPVQAGGEDPVVRGTTWDASSGAVTVPARTVAVLLEG